MGRNREEIPLQQELIEDPSIQDPRWSIEEGQNLQAAAQIPKRHSLGTVALGLIREKFLI